MKIEEAIKQKKFDTNVQKALINLVYTYHWVSERQDSVFERFDITPQQFNVLRILRGRHPQTLCMGEIKDVMLDKNPDMTRLCDRLLKKNLIERQFNEHNRRQVLVKITDEGLTLLEEIDPHIKDQAKKYKLNEEDAQRLSDLLDKLRE